MDPEPLVFRLRRACRCGAKTRAGTPCQSPAIKGRKRCRMHGGRSPGAPKGEASGNYVSGRWTVETIKARATVRGLVKLCRRTLLDLA
ncbi:HGGxSTG domain-containing protein [Brevundimonas sp. TWP2-3-4b1]|uniref:HGGxSTG domain-containing protein n=1 Tax=Brevundimonas sp. TWP2-3-4b1 TaxID=2804580 RepID=UPI003CFB125C